MWEQSYFIYRSISVPSAFHFLSSHCSFYYSSLEQGHCVAQLCHTQDLYAIASQVLGYHSLKRKKKMNHIGHLFKILQSSHYSSNTLGLFDSWLVQDLASLVLPHSFLPFFCCESYASMADSFGLPVLYTYLSPF